MRMRSLCGLLVAGFSFANATAQTPCTPDGNGAVPYLTVNPTPNGQQSWPLSLQGVSRAWYSDRFSPQIRGLTAPGEVIGHLRYANIGDYDNRPLGGDSGNRFAGFPLNHSLGFGPTPPDFAGMGVDAASAPSPLVPASAAHFGLPTAPPQRATLEGEVDLITGSPLITQVDLTLPFGGAVFRHVRTYSEPSSDFWHEQEAIDGPSYLAGRTPATIPLYERDDALSDELFNDWHGQGWMMGENPLFLFDAAYETLTAQPADGTVAAETTRVCYFIPDAHHSIPFVRVVEPGEAMPRYVAPPHIDAMMTVDDGTFNQTTGEWTSFPTTVSVWLHGRTVRYKVQIQKNADGSLADVPTSSDSVSLHASPASTTVVRGTGMPGWGRVERIEDRYGNRVLLEYADEIGRVVGPVPDSDCQYVHQNSNERGQLKAARLVTSEAADSAPTWTLFFLNRSFRSVDYWGLRNGQPSEYYSSSTFLADHPYLFPYHRQNAVIAVFAYRGAVASPAGGLTVDAKYFDWLRDPGLPSPVESGDPSLVNEPMGTSDRAYLRRATQLVEFGRLKFGLPADWVHKVSYLYSEPTPALHEPTHRPEWGCNNDSPRLLTAKTESRDVQESVKSTERVYRYLTPKIHGSHWLYDTLFLTHVYEGASIEAVVKSARAAATLPEVEYGVVADEHADVITVATALLGDRCLGVNSQGQPVGSWTTGVPMYRYANRSFLRAGLVANQPIPGVGAHVHRVPKAARDFLGSIVDRAAVMTYGGVEYWSGATDKEPVLKNHRLQRLIVHPAVASVPEPEGPFENFRLLPEVRSGNFPETIPQIGRSVLHYPYRLIMNAADVKTPSAWHAAQAADQPTFIAIISGTTTPNPESSVPQSTSDEKITNIRIVQMNAAGVVLRDTLVPCDGESEPIEQVATLEDSFVRDPRGSIVERRTAGYHSKENLTPAANGMVEVFVYDYRGFVYSTAQTQWLQRMGSELAERTHMLSPPDVPVFAQLVGRGFKFGNQTSTWYMTHGVKYHENNPELMAVEVDFAQPQLMSQAPSAATVKARIDSHLLALDPSDAVRTHTYEFYAATQPAVAGANYQSSGSTLGSIFGQPRPATTTLPFSDYARLKTHTTVHRTVTSAAGSNIELVELQRFDNSGRPGVVAKGYRPAGTTSSPSDFGASFRLTDGGGRLVYGGSLTDWPASDGSSATLRAATISRVSKDRDGRPVRVDAPDGRVTFFLYRKDDTDPNRTIRVTYRSVDPSTMVTRLPVVLEYIRGTSVELEQGRLLAAPVSVSIPPIPVVGRPTTQIGDSVAPMTAGSSDPTGLAGTGVESATVVYEKRAERDGAGRLTGLTLVDPTSPTSTLGFGIERDAFGKLTRLRSMTGALTRTIYDRLGRPIRTYRGTTDLHEVWGTAIVGTDPCTVTYDQDNMLLVKGQDYGTGVNDAGQPTTTRSPRSRAANQYELTGCDPLQVPPSTVNEVGLSDRVRYDTRMRPVWREIAPSITATASRVEVTWLDAQDRPCIEATFTAAKAAALGASLDPRTCSITSMPTAAQIVAKQPLSLTETIYDGQGRAAEVRDYDVLATVTPRWTSVRTFYDYQDRAIKVQTPTGTSVTEYDTKGRVHSVTELAGSTEVSKTVNTYNDADDTLIETLSLARVVGGGTAALESGVNAVRTRTFHWYDAHKNRIASVELGTESSTDIYVSGSAATRPLDAPCVYDGSNRLSGFSLPTAISGGMASCWEYDYADRVIGQVASDGRVTRTSYDGLGRVVRVDENATSSDPAVKRTTEYAFDAQGRLSLIGAGNKYFAPGTAWSTNSDAEIRVTKLEYGAPVVTEAYLPLRGASSTTSGVPLTDPDKVWKVYLPEAATGRPGTTASLEFAYLLTGEIAWRRDLRTGVTLEFAHDDRGNMTSWKADLSGVQTPPGGFALDQVEQVVYTYDALDRLKNAKAIAKITQGAEEVIADTGFDYDGRGNLSGEHQAHGKLAGFDTPKIEYTRAFTAASATATGRDRLTSIQYPCRDIANNSNPYTLELGYGAAGSVDDELSRVASLGEQGATRRLADFSFMGDGLRVSTSRGVLASSGASASVDRAWSDGYAGVGYDRLDRFGRTRTARVEKVGSGGTLSLLWQMVTAYDAGGRRTHERISTGTTTATDNANSWLYSYDTLDRLIGAHRGRLNTGNSALETTSARREVDWTLDPLGSWAGSGTAFGRRTAIKTASGTTTWDIKETDAVNGQEGINQRSRKVNAGSVVATQFASDATGNLQFDGRYLYQYDSLGRLVQVNQKGTCTVDGSGKITGTPGPWVTHRTYDGLGRLIRTQAPWPSADLASSGFVVSRRFYYDGDRRIARVSTQPYTPEGGNLGDPGRIKGEIDLEQELNWLSTTDRLWVWDSTDVDRLVAVYGDSADNSTPPSSPLTRAWLAVTDLDGTPVAMLDHSTGSAVSRYSFDPTGGVLEATTSAAPDGVYPPRLEVGWKGLFAERLDYPLTDSVLTPEDGSSGNLTGSGAAVIYDVRARVYRPWLGRFLQQDPLGMGVPVTQALRWHGQEPPMASPAGFNAGSHYADGQHALAFARGRSIGREDPTGLLIDLIGPTTVGDLWSNHTQKTLEWGNDIRLQLTEWATQYAFDQFLDMEWAGDWSQSDYGYSKSGIELQEPAEAGVESGVEESPQTSPEQPVSGMFDKILKKKLVRAVDAAQAGVKAGRGVYFVLDSNGAVAYIGRSVNMARRAVQSMGERSGTAVKCIPIPDKDNWYAIMRGIEQAGIEAYGTLGKKNGNVINGISETAKEVTKSEYIQAAKSFLMSLANQ